MSSKTPELLVIERELTGKKVKKLRAEGGVPAVIYERGEKSVNITVQYLPLIKAYNSVGKHRPLELKLGSKNKLAMIKVVDTDPVKNMIRHIEFHAINQNEKVTAEVGVVITGEVPAAKASLVVLETLRTVEIEALPAKLPDQLEIDGTNLIVVGDRVLVSDIKPIEGVTILTEAEKVVAVVEEPRSAEAEAAVAAAEAEAAGEKMEELSGEDKPVETTEEAK